VNRRLLEYSPLFDGFSNWTGAPAAVAPMSDGGDEMALAADLLEVGTEAELERVLRRVIGRAGILGARVLRSPMAPVLIAELKGATRQVLPLGRRTRVVVASGPLKARRIAHGANLFGLELEGLSPEDKEFALGQQMVRFAGEAARNAGKAPVSSPAAARAAVLEAARRHAPGLLPQLQPPPSRQGRWSRQDGRIVLHDC
jgi:hypothetical protein